MHKSDDDIIGQLVKQDRGLIGISFNITGFPDNRRFPDITYNSAHNQYLVVWESEDASGFDGIQGRRISNICVGLDANDIVIKSKSSTYTSSKPTVAYSPSKDQYLVVWWKHGILHRLNMKFFGKSSMRTGCLLVADSQSPLMLTAVWSPIWSMTSMLIDLWLSGSRKLVPYGRFTGNKYKQILQAGISTRERSPSHLAIM
jgi:hypothetical protein